MSQRPQAPPGDAAPLLALQVLRAVAALMVVVHHAGYDADTLASRSGRPPLALERGFDWTFGIHLFFVISGFIMLRTARGFGSPGASATFAIRRLIRVVPLYWLLTALVILGALADPDLLNVPLGGPDVIAGSFAFVPVYRADGAINPVLGQGWTLEFEMAFYALFTIALLLPRRLGLAALAATLVALASLGRAAHPQGALASVWTSELLLEFLFGMAVGLLMERGARLGAMGALAVVAAGVGAAIALGPVTTAFAGMSPVLKAGVPATLIVAGAVLGPRWPAHAALLPLAALGDASYSLYLSHPFVIRLLRVAWATFIPPGVPLTLYAAVSCTTAIAISLLLYRLVERPMTRALQRRTKTGLRPLLPDAALREG